MTTKRQVKRLLDQLLARNPDLAMAGPRPMVALRPVHHFLCGVFVDRTSEAARFKPYWNLTCLFTLRQGVSVHDGVRISRHKLSEQTGMWFAGHFRSFRERSKLWYWPDPGVEEEFCDQVENEVLPRLRKMRALEAGIAVATGDEIMGSPLAWHGDRMLAHIAMGELDAARAIWTANRHIYDLPDWPDYRQSHIDRCRLLGRLLMADDRAALAAQLHTWEAKSVANIGVDHLWERTPFPLEEIA